MSRGKVSAARASDANERYALTRELTTRMIARDRIEIRARAAAVVLPLTTYLILLKFAEAKSLRDACAEFGVELDTQHDVATQLAQLIDAGILRTPSAPEPVGESLIDVLDPKTFADRATRSTIATALRAGRLVAVRNAFQPAFANAVYRSLKTIPLHEAGEPTTHWDPHQGFSPGFFYDHHNLYDPWAWPPVLRRAHAAFADKQTRTFIGELTARDCSAAPEFSASLYLPGDHSLPHDDDDGNGRSVAFVWHLTKEWDPQWGGALYWCPTGASLMPTYNTLLMFVVSKQSAHFVTTVTPHARGRRLAINGWWRTPPDARRRPAVKRAPKASKFAESLRGDYGPPLESIDRGRIVVI